MLFRSRVDPDETDRLLGIIEARCLTGQNGAAWQVATVQQLQEKRHLARPHALQVMALRYAEHMHSNEPVHTWPVEG